MKAKDLEELVKGLDLDSNPNLKQYIDDIKNYGEISRQEMGNLAIEAHNGDENAKEQLINYSQKHVLKHVLSICNNPDDILDIVQECNITIIEKIIENYDDNELKDYIGLLYRIIPSRIKIASFVAEKARESGVLVSGQAYTIEQNIKKIEKEEGRTPTINELASLTGKSLDTLKAYLNITKKEEGSYREKQGRIKDLSIMDEDPVTKFENKELSKFIIDDLFAILSEREQNVITLLFGLDGGGKKTIKEVSKIIGISEIRVTQIRNGAFKKMSYRYRFGRKRYYNVEPNTNSHKTDVFTILGKRGYSTREISIMLSSLRNYQRQYFEKKYGYDYSKIRDGYTLVDDNYFRDYVMPELLILLNDIREELRNSEHVDQNKLDIRLRKLNYEIKIRDWLLRTKYVDNKNDLLKRALTMRFGLIDGISRSKEEFYENVGNFDIDFYIRGLLTENDILNPEELEDFMNLNYPKGKTL